MVDGEIPYGFRPGRSQHDALDALAYLREAPGGEVHPGAADQHQADAGETPGDQGDALSHVPPAGARVGALAGAGAALLLRVSRRAHHLAAHDGVRLPRGPVLAARADAAQPEGLCPVAADQVARCTLDSIGQGPTPVAAIPLSRQTPEVGAECGRSAGSDLSGGRGVTRVPTGMACHQGRTSVGLRRSPPWHRQPPYCRRLSVPRR